MKQLNSIIIALALFFSVQAPAQAMEPKGKVSRVIAVTVLTPSSLDYNSYRGSLLLYPVDGVSPMETYKWGGINCPGTDLTTTQIDTLSTLIQRKDVWVTAHYKSGQPAPTRCLVGFSIMTL